MLAVIVSLVASVAVSTGQQCSVDNLQFFEDLRERGLPRDVVRPDRDRFQAIVPAYTFQCSGRVTEWRACVDPGGGADQQYYIQFQVWRPTGNTDGCYTLVGHNTPLQDARQPVDEFLSPSGDSSDPLRRCVELSVRDTEQIEVQQGDVVGYYVDHFRAGSDRNDGGIQWMEDSNDVVVYYRYDLPRDDIRPAYAIDGPNPAECGFDISGDSNSYSISSSTTAAPILSLSIVTTPLTPPPPPDQPLPEITTSMMTSTKMPPPSPTPPPVVMSPVSSSPPAIFKPSTITMEAVATPDSSTSSPSPPLPPPPAILKPTKTTTESPATTTPSADAPSITDTGGSGSDTVVIALIVVTILALATAVTVVFVVILIKRKEKAAASPTLNNPSYMTSPNKPTGTQEVKYRQTSPSTTPYYDYARVGAESERHTIKPQPPPEERVYATLENVHRPQHEVAATSHTYHNVDSPHLQHDHTVTDPTSPAYVSAVYSSGSVFDTAGTCVPTLEARTANYEVADAGKKYSTLQFFERDQVFWDPASTTLGLYEQLFTKHYREISRNQLRILEKIGSGQFGTVSKGVWEYQNETMQVAVKTLTNTASEMETVKFLQEAAIMGQFYHPNIVRLHGVVTVGNPVLIVLDFMPNGDMKSYLDHLVVRHDDHTRLSRQFLKYGCEIAAGMAYLAKKSFVHRDLAARNILLDQYMCCKVGDFGMARDLMDDTYYKSKGGKIPVKWTAPEALHYKKYSTASDVWSYAMVLYEIWSVGKKPFLSLSNSDVIARLQSNQCQDPPSGCPRQVYSLMVDCWNPEPHLRPSFDTVFHALHRPEELLLHWTEEDVAAERHLLRATHTTHSFSDLQNKYSNLCQ